MNGIRYFLLPALALGMLNGEPAANGQKQAEVPKHTLTVISGQPRERGRMYGEKFRKAIHAFLEREIYQAFNGKPATKQDMLAYAGACAKEIASYAPVISEELEGIAQGAGLRLEEVVLITLHEELYHRGVLPKVDHCTAVAIGPPATADGHTYVGQTWDWMTSVFGMSSMLHWKRSEGPSLLSYSFPGLWAGAGLNSSGLALCWTSASLGNKAMGVRVGIPSYVLLTHFLYQETLDDVIREAKRAKHAGWFTFVMADAKGNLLNLEGSPKEMHVERHKAMLARISFGSRHMTGTPENAAVKLHPRCQHMYELIAGSSGKIGTSTFQDFFANPKHKISVGKSTIDMMVFDTTAREAWVSRGPSYAVDWQKFSFSAEK